jgi:fructose-1,6-bisphosphatase/inositol monophosphatase family enzyme
MKLEHFESSEDSQDPKIFRVIKEVQETTADSLESIKAGFAFPVPQEIRNMSDTEQLSLDSEGRETVGTKELLRTSLQALKRAWEEAVRPQIGKVRSQGVQTLKQGADFFTQADVDGEKVVKDTFIDAFGSGTLQIFGEEANEYSGNPDSLVSVRIDPIDGTESFKFGKANWGIMLGIYQGELGRERQIISATYFPERGQLMYGVEGVGTFVAEVASGKTLRVDSIEPQDDLKNMVVSYWKHSDTKQRGEDDPIQNKLTEAGARIRNTESTCGDVLEALLTRGQRIIVYDGDMSIVDYIPCPLIERMGYRIYGWDGREYQAEDPDLANAKVVIVPPGKAGEQVREIIREVVSEQKA